MDLRIDRIETWACSLELAEPLSFGSYTIRTREYVAVAISTAGGLRSECIALSRRLPVDIGLQDVYAPRLLGQDADLTARTADCVHDLPMIEAIGVMGAAWSLVDICLWDLRAQAAGEPLWQLLGGSPRQLPVLMVEGYDLDGEDDDDFAARLAERVVAGYRALKIEGASESDPQRLARRLEKVREAVGDDVALVVDMGWKYPTAEAAAAEIAVWKHTRPAWVEDCLPRGQVEQTARLRGLAGAPIGAGDEVSGTAEAARLISADAVDVLRLDIATMGGISAAGQLAPAAADAGLRTSPHMHPELHRHCALAYPGIEYVEAFPGDRGFDLEHHLLTEPFTNSVVAGRAPAPTAPGTGLSLDRDAVAAACYRHLVNAL